MASLYENIREACIAKGITPSAMCLELGMSKSTMSDLKSGRKKSLSTETLHRIASFLNVSADYLLTGKGPEQKQASDLSEEDERDIARMLDSMLGQLGDSNAALMFDGEPVDNETRELLKISLENQFRLAKRMMRQKDNQE